MPLLTKATKSLTDRLPPVISPGAHAVIDYAVAGVFLVSSLAFWKRNRPAAVAAMICGGSELLLAAMTDYPGGIVPDMSFRTHGRIDSGMPLLVASLPEFLNFTHTKQSRLFDAQAIAMAATAGLTDFEGTGKSKQLARLEEEEEVA